MNSLKSRMVVLFAALALVPAMISAQSFPVQKYKLSNGMTVILRVDHTLPLVALNLWYHVGSKDEPPHRSGFAHLFEHLMFMGTRRVPTGQFDRIMESGGGDNNASTAEDRTNFYDFGPSNLLPTLLWLEADRMEELGKCITQAKLNLQREVVKNERRENTENRPYGTADEMVNGLLFPAGHPYHTSVIGSMADLDRATVADVRRFFDTFYVPNNVTMVVAGDFDPGPVKLQIQRLFGTLPARPAVVRKPWVDPRLHASIETTVADKVAAPKIMLLWHSPAAYQRGDAEMELAASVLGDGPNSRLYQRLVVHDKVATDVEVGVNDLLLGSIFELDVIVRTGADLQYVRHAIESELRQFVEKGPTADELKRQSAKIETQALNTNQSLLSVADSLNSYDFYLGFPNAFKADLDRYRRASPASVREEAHRILSADRLSILVQPSPTGPVAPNADAPANPNTQSASADAAAAQTPPATAADAPSPTPEPSHPRPSARDIRPAIGLLKPFTAPAPVVVTLKNGMKLNYWQRPELPLVSLALQLPSGSLSDPEGKDGAASLMANLLPEGAGVRSSIQFRNALDLLGASVTVSTQLRSTEVWLNTLARNFPAAGALYADAIRRPRFDVADFERTKRVRIADLEQELDDVGQVSNLVAVREFFPAGSAFGRPTNGSAKTVAAIQLADVRDRFASVVRPSNAAFYGAGSLSPAAIADVLNRYFGDWQPKSKPPVQTVAPLVTSAVDANAPKGPRVFLVDKPNSPQTAVHFMMPAIAYRSGENRVRLSDQTLTTILGGTFTSRLNQNLREDKGYTYGAFAQQEFDRSFGYVEAQSEVRTDVTGASIKEFLKEFDRFKSGSVSPEEVRSSTSTIRSESVQELGTLQGLVGRAMALSQFGRPFSAIGEDIKTLSSLNASELNRLATHAFRYESGVLVLVGDANAIRSQIAGLNLQEPVLVKLE